MTTRIAIIKSQDGDVVTYVPIGPDPFLGGLDVEAITERAEAMDLVVEIAEGMTAVDFCDWAERG
jgi:hypothetical protein